MLSEAGTLFEELGFYYVGPIDGHDLDNMVKVLENLRDNTPPGKPVLLHLKTEKGFGYAPAMAASDKMHGVAKYDVATGKQFKGKGGKPFCCIYSTFLQRGYDQLVHDVVIQKLPVRFILDRAGLVGNDGPTHHGAYDLAYLGCMPDLVIMAPAHEVDLMNMLRTSHAIDERPTALRYPRGNGYGVEKLNELFGLGLTELPEKGEVLEA